MNTYKIADLIIKMNPKYDPLLSQAKAYLINTSESVDLVIPDITKDVLAYHKENQDLTIGDCEYIMYASYFYTKLIEYNGIYLHASAVVKDGFCYMFSAPSGTGKSTHTNLWLKNIKDSLILNDDKPAIRIFDDAIYAYGTPFSGKHDLSINKKYPLKGISFIYRDSKNTISKINPNESLSLMMAQTVRSKQEKYLVKTLSMLETILTKIPIYKMGCTISKEAALMSYNTMKGPTL
ncbi:hypothetical protein [Acholeplasma laidlawii]|uniref:hypothetical protein n=1 Tax=Acholeplasma laidlawii TaxID=2148 RepID=UPI002540FE55|nr:hypothetical protein QOL21_01015 [Acholeplasma laidlawii]